VILLGSIRETSQAKTPHKPKVKAGIPRIWLFVLLVLGALVLGDLNQRMVEARRLEKEAAQLAQELTDLDAGIAGLKAEIERANEADAVERWAREEAKMVRPGEHLVILIAPDGKPLEPVPAQTTPEPLPSNMEVWLELLFGR
jgi:cell division protein FtsB